MSAIALCDFRDNSLIQNELVVEIRAVENLANGTFACWWSGRYSNDWRNHAH